MKTARKDMKNENVVVKVAQSVSFSSERLSKEKVVSKGRESYIKSVSAKALSSISNL